MEKTGIESAVFFSAMALVALSLPTVAMAADPVGVFTLGEIEVSAKTDETTTNPTVDRIYADELRQFDRNTIADAANLLPGASAPIATPTALPRSPPACRGRPRPSPCRVSI